MRDGVEPEEGAEDVFAPIGRNARAVVVDIDGEEALVAEGLDLHFLGMDQGVADEIGKTALERGRAHDDLRVALERDGDLRAVPLCLAAQPGEKILHVDLRRRFAGIAAGEGEIGLQHPLHFLDVFLHVLGFRRHRPSARARA